MRTRAETRGIKFVRVTHDELPQTIVDTSTMLPPKPFPAVNANIKIIMQVVGSQWPVSLQWYKWGVHKTPMKHTLSKVTILWEKGFHVGSVKWQPVSMFHVIWGSSGLQLNNFISSLCFGEELEDYISTSHHQVFFLQWFCYFLSNILLLCSCSACTKFCHPLFSLHYICFSA